MWYKFSKEYGLNEIDNMANIVRNMNPYNTEKHLDLFRNPDPPKELLPDSVEDRVKLLYEGGAKSRAYLGIHPQIYVYPSNSEKVWRYIYFDPKHLERMHNDDFHHNLSTGISINRPMDEAMDFLHQKYPTALIDYYETEEELLRDR